MRLHMFTLESHQEYESVQLKDPQVTCLLSDKVWIKSFSHKLCINKAHHTE